MGGTEQDAELLIAGAQDGSLDRYIAGVWTKTEMGGDNGEAIIDPDNKATIHYQTQLKYAKSTNGGSSFSNFYPVIDGTSGAYLFPMEIDPTNPNNLSSINNFRIDL